MNVIPYLSYSPTSSMLVGRRRCNQRRCCQSSGGVEPYEGIGVLQGIREGSPYNGGAAKFRVNENAHSGESHAGTVVRRLAGHNSQTFFPEASQHYEGAATRRWRASRSEIFEAWKRRLTICAEEFEDIFCIAALVERWPRKASRNEERRRAVQPPCGACLLVVVQPLQQQLHVICTYGEKGFPALGRVFVFQPIRKRVASVLGLSVSHREDSEDTHEQGGCDRDGELGPLAHKRNLARCPRHFNPVCGVSTRSNYS